MPRRKNPDDRTARERIADVIRWGENRQGFYNIADDLRHALALLPDEEHGRG
jgi:hypothetical protein